MGRGGEGGGGGGGGTGGHEYELMGVSPGTALSHC